MAKAIVDLKKQWILNLELTATMIKTLFVLLMPIYLLLFFEFFLQKIFQIKIQNILLL